jgi:hypothetical protein
MTIMPEGRRSREGKGSMTVEEAGRKGGQRVRELIAEGKEAEKNPPREGGRLRRGSSIGLDLGDIKDGRDENG